MGCSTCGRRYTPQRSSAAIPVNKTQKAKNPPSVSRNPNRRAVVMKSQDTDPSKGIIQPQPEAGVIVPAPDYPVEPAIGIPLSVITTGECSENSLGKTTIASVGTGEQPDQYWESPSEKREGADD